MNTQKTQQKNDHRGLTAMPDVENSTPGQAGQEEVQAAQAAPEPEPAAGSQGEPWPDAGSEKPGLKIDWAALGKIMTPADAKRAGEAFFAAAQARADEMKATVETMNHSRTWPLSCCVSWQPTNACAAQLLWNLFGAANGCKDNGEPREDDGEQELLFDRNSKRETLYLWNGHYWEEDDHNRRYPLTTPLLTICRAFMTGCKQLVREIEAQKKCLPKHVSAGAMDAVSEELDSVAAFWSKTVADNLRKMEKSLQSVAFVDQVIRWASSGPGSLGDSGMHWDDVDAVRNRLPTPGGVLRLDRYRVEQVETGNPGAAPEERFLPDETLRPGRPSDRYLMHTAVKYRAAARGHKWRLFVKGITGNDLELAKYLQTLVGAAICRDTHAATFAVLYGTGANGKSIFKKVLTAALGPELSNDVPPAIVVQGRGESANTPSAAHMALRGRAIVWMEELKTGVTLDVGSMKQISQGTKVTAREPFATKQVSFYATAIPFLLTNEKPKVLAQDDGTWRRLILIPMDQKFLTEAVMVQMGIDPNNPGTWPAGVHLANPDIDQELTAPNELPGVLAWAVEGAFRYREHGMPKPPNAVVNATREWAKESDTLADFIDECLLVDRSDTPVKERSETATADIWRVYQSWAQINGMRFPLSKNRLKQELLKRRNAAGLPLFEARLVGTERRAGLRGCRVNPNSDAAREENAWRTGRDEHGRREV